MNSTLNTIKEKLMKKPIPILLLAADYIVGVGVGVWQSPKALLANAAGLPLWALILSVLGVVVFAVSAYGLWEMREWARRLVLFMKALHLAAIVIPFLGLAWSTLVIGMSAVFNQHTSAAFEHIMRTGSNISLLFLPIG